ncbi:MAG: hypothetical protein JWN41_320, partial [Thermoleophilia bacterium]|nr:hypothetical protein [Thermoleophilia bacterium]
MFSEGPVDGCELGWTPLASHMGPGEYSMSAINSVGNFMAHSKGAKIAGIGIGVTVLLGLTACAMTQTPEQYTNNLFKDFDRDPNNNGISRDEATRHHKSTHSTDVFQYRIGDIDVFDRQVIQHSWTSSVLRAVDAARGNDAVASWQELNTLANTYDVDGKPGLSGKEQSRFSSVYGPITSNSREEILSHQTVYREHSYPTHDYDGYDPSDPGGTSPGDSGGSGSTGGTSSGDSGGGWGNTGGTSGGDSGPSSPSSPSEPSTPSAPSGGDSTDNGNPSEDD